MTEEALRASVSGGLPDTDNGRECFSTRPDEPYRTVTRALSREELDTRDDKSFHRILQGD